ncbi:Serine/threonine-protein kinase PLK5 [Fukomys damarensis]|uniref:Serine/threonine-protein kinase PLK5 n=1 Tax=Fukomys damarensis TaxID=885580 RepID=A0A091DCT9_FUKDA|nr:Serine/threonine-protein kinase PLK5 [Fukomys damarensis]
MTLLKKPTPEDLSNRNSFDPGAAEDLATNPGLHENPLEVRRPEWTRELKLMLPSWHLVDGGGCGDPAPVLVPMMWAYALELSTCLLPLHLLISMGAFSRCYKLTDMATSAVFALKVVPRIGGGAGRLRCKGKVEREIALHSSLRHRNIVAFHGHFADRDHVYMVLEYCGRQSLAHVLKARQTLTEPEVRYYLRGVVSGLRYLHQRRIVHRDLKLSNFFLNNNMEVKIGDLGLAARVGPGGRCHRVLCGTPNFLAPEVVSRNGHTCQSDIWALGCILYTVLTGSPPFPVAPVSEMYENIRAGRYPEPAHLSPNARHLIARLLAPNPAERPSLDQLLQDNFFTQGFTPERLPPRSCRSPPNFAVPRPLGSLFRKVGRLLLAECRPHRPFTPKEDLGSGAEGLEPYPMEWGSEAAFSGTQALLVLNRAGKDLLLSLWRPGWPGAPCSLHTLRMLGCSPVARQRLRLALRLPRGILGWGSAAFPCVQHTLIIEEGSVGQYWPELFYKILERANRVVTSCVHMVMQVQTQIL